MDLDTTNQAAADVLEGARNEKRLTQEQVAAASGIPLVTLQRALSGKTALKVGPFLAICAAIGVDPGEIMARVTNRAKELSVVADTNVIQLRPKPVEEMTVEEIEGIERYAANRDPEASEDEHFD